MAFFNDITDANAFYNADNNIVDDLNEFDVGIRYINELSSHRPSERYFELLVLIEGSVSRLVNGDLQPVAPQTVIFSFPGEGCEFVANDDLGVCFCSVLISPCILTEFCDLVSRRAMDLLYGEEGQKSYRMQFRDFEYFMHLTELAISSDSSQSKILSKRVAYNLVSQLILSLDKDSIYPGWFERFLEQIQSPETFLSPMSEIYKLAPYSQPMLNSYFNRFMGETLVSYITKLKIKYACNLLRFSDLPVVDIAAKTKYSSLSHFNHIFKKHVGTTPSEYRINSFRVNNEQ